MSTDVVKPICEMFSSCQEALDKMEKHLADRLNNIRAHVVKLSQPDLFLQESLESLEIEMKDAASQLLAAATSRRVSRLGWTEFEDSVATLKQSLEKAQLTIPPPTRNQNNRRETALLHLERLRAASQALLAFLVIPDKGASGIPRGVLAKCHSLGVKSLEFISEATPQLVGKVEEKEKTVTLEDAWNKVMQLPAEDDSSLLDQPVSKRLKLEAPSAPIVRSQVLLTAGRKTSSNLLPELKRKGARLVRPPPNGEGSHLVLEFGDAFVMTIYLVPLLVTLRAATKVEDKITSDAATWTSTGAGLDEQTELRVWGVTGTPEVLGHVVEHQLNYASAQATHVLRKCFMNSNKARNDFEAEISEGTALLHFIHLARTTYTPNFEEVDA